VSTNSSFSRSPISKTVAKGFRRRLKNAAEEKQVEPVYHDFLKRVLPNDYEVVTKVGNIKTDGYARPRKADLFDSEHQTLVVLLEAKFGYDFDRVSDRAKVMTQALYYAKRVMEVGEAFPTIFLCADDDQMFLLYGGHFRDYLISNPDDPEWLLTPSVAHMQNPHLVRRLMEDSNLNTLVYNVDDPGFDFNTVADRMLQLYFSAGKLEKIEITEQNLRTLLERFETAVGLDKKASSKIDDNSWARRVVAIFTNAITGHPEQYLIPGKNKLRLVGGEEINIDPHGWAAFFDVYAKVSDFDEKQRFRAISEGLVPEVERRASGDFWTPTEWTNRAHQAITDAFGPDWYSTYAVWDPAWGTGNLTRDYQFGSLYASTLFSDELDIATEINNNDSTVKFQYDYLNDDLDLQPGGKLTPQGVLKPEFVITDADDAEVRTAKQERLNQVLLSGETDVLYYKMPPSLYRDLSDPLKPFMWFMNPPYNRAGNQAKNAAGKGTTATGIQEMIRNDPLNRGKYSSQLYAQFFYRTLKIIRDFRKTKAAICAFSKSQYLSGGLFWEPLFRQFAQSMEYRSGFLMNASEFADVSDKWGVFFAVWGSGKTETRLFPFTIEELTERGPEVIGNHVLRAVEGPTIRQMIPVPSSRKALGVEKGNWHVKQFPVDWKNGEDAFGSIPFHSQNVEQINQYTWIDNAWTKQSVPITPENFEVATLVLALGRSIKHTWWQDKDNFVPPADEILTTEDYQQAQVDSIVVALMEVQTSLRDVVSPDGEPISAIINEWFWLPTEYVRKSAAKASQEAVLTDLQNHAPLSGERFICSQIDRIATSETTFSPKAATLLGLLTQAFDTTMRFRDFDNLDHPEWSLQSWDAGWKQIYEMLNKRSKRSGKYAGYFSAECAELLQAINSAESDLLMDFERRVYEWGVLLKPEMRQDSITSFDPRTTL